MPLVMRKAAARDNASPNHPVCHSHSFLLHIRAFGVDLGTVGPGTRKRQTMKMMAAGAARPQIAKVAVDIFSLATKG